MRIQTQRRFWPRALTAAVALLFSAMINPDAGRAQGQAFQSGAPHLRLVWARVADHNGELGSVECAEFSPDGRHIATATKYSNEIAVWRVADGARVWNQKVEQEVKRVMFSPDGKMLAAGGEDDLLRIFNAGDGKLLNSYRHTSAIDSLRWSPDGKLLAAGEESGKIRLWQMPAGKELKVVDVGAEAAVNEIDFSSDGQFMTAIGNKREIRVWRVADMTIARTLKDKDDLPTISIRISADGRFVAAGGQGGHIFVWNFADGTLAKKINFTGRKIETVCFTPDGQHLLFAGHDQHIRVLRVSDWASVFLSEPVDNMEYLSFSRNGSFLVSAHQDGIVRLWVWMFGDINIQNRQNPGGAFRNLLPTLRGADARFANCEMLFVEPSNDPMNPDIPHKLTWRHSHPSQVKGLVEAGFDAVGLTSNVTYPVSALLKTLPVLQQAGIPFTGSGRNLAEARRPVIIERKGVKIGFQQWTSIFWHIGHAATETTPGVSTVKIHTSYQPHRRINEMPGGPPTVVTIPDAEELAHFTSDIRALRQKVDIVVASLQYGISSSTEVADYQRTLARAAIDAGADIVIGHGPHMLQPVEVYKGKPVFLSLGNFVFDWPKMKEKQDGLMARAVIRDRKLAGVSFVPLRRDADNNPILLDPNTGAGADMIKQLRELGAEGGATLKVKGKEVIVAGIDGEISRAARK